MSYKSRFFFFFDQGLPSFYRRHIKEYKLQNEKDGYQRTERPLQQTQPNKLPPQRTTNKQNTENYHR